MDFDAIFGVADLPLIIFASIADDISCVARLASTSTQFQGVQTTPSLSAIVENARKYNGLLPDCRSDAQRRIEVTRDLGNLPKNNDDQLMVAAHAVHRLHDKHPGVRQAALIALAKQKHHALPYREHVTARTFDSVKFVSCSARKVLKSLTNGIPVPRWYWSNAVHYV